MKLHFLSPPNSAEATKISKSKSVVPVSNFKASTHSVCKEQYLLKQSVALLPQLNPIINPEIRCLTLAVIKTDLIVMHSLKLIFWDLHPLSLLYPSAASCLKMDSYVSHYIRHYIHCTPHMMDLHFLTRCQSSPMVEVGGSFIRCSNKHKS